MRTAGIKDTLYVSGPNGTTYIWNNGNTDTTYYTGPIDADSVFYVVATNGGCSDTARYIMEIRPIPNAVPSISGTDFTNVYPNPSSTGFTVDLPIKAQINVCDITGRI